jgi:hypothetical protein
MSNVLDRRCRVSQNMSYVCMFSFGYFPGVRLSVATKLNLTPGKYPKENIQVSEHGENLKSRMFYVERIFPESRTVYRIMWKKYRRARKATHDNILRCIRIACWLTKCTNTHPEYVISIAFSRKHRLHERAAVSRLYLHYLSCSTYKNT